MTTTYNVEVTSYDKRKNPGDPTAWERENVTIQAANKRHAASIALSRIGYGELRQHMTHETCMGAYAAEYRNIATYYLYPTKTNA